LPADLLVVGLGNPGKEFANTRHNAGADVVELLARRHDARLKKSRRDRALVGDARVAGKRVVLAVPLTYMNDSGRALAPLAKHYDVAPEQIVVVHDELDLPPAALRVKVGGGLAGHNGLRSIVQHLHSDEFVRVRIGVGKPPSKERGADHVLARASKRDREEMAVTIEEAADAVELIVTDGPDAAMNRYNARP
jgi:PTH1 family peptidyl-tRNA hydrolase